MDRRASILFWFIPVVLGCASMSTPAQQPSPALDAAPLLELRLAHNEPEPNRVRFEHNGNALYLDAEPLVTDADITAAEAAAHDGYILLSLQLSPNAAARLGAATERTIGSHMALLFESSIATAMVIRSALGQSLHMQLQIPVADPQRAAQLVRSRWPDQGI